jgi:hypothetical protein
MTPEELEKRRAAANPPKQKGAELLEDGQEEVFSRTEVETGRIEHATGSAAHSHAAPAADGRSYDAVMRDEAETLRLAPNDASPGESASS